MAEQLQQQMPYPDGTVQKIYYQQHFQETAQSEQHKHSDHLMETLTAFFVTTQHFQQMHNDIAHLVSICPDDGRRRIVLLLIITSGIISS